MFYSVFYVFFGFLKDAKRINPCGYPSARFFTSVISTPTFFISSQKRG